MKIVPNDNKRDFSNRYDGGEGFVLESHGITEIEGLEELTKLKKLRLFGNEIKKIKGLENLKNLEPLIFGDTYHYNRGNDI